MHLARPAVEAKSKAALVLGAEPRTQQQLAGLLRAWNYEPLAVGKLDDALAALAHTRFALSLVDLGADGADGVEVLRELRRGGDPGPIVVLAAPNGLALASDFAAAGPGIAVIQRPFMPAELERAIREAFARSPRAVGPGQDPDDPVFRLGSEIGLWQSSKMREVWEIIQHAAGVDVTVLVCGQTGTGKDLVARAVHQLSPRQDRAFVKVNCAAVPRELLESELFGHERGAFTGAHQLKVGKFEAANHGTVFLDEIGDLHQALQAKLLHVLQDGTFSRVGGKSTIKVDVRVLAATNRDLEREVLEDRFREDLYYRLNVIQIVIPPLRERPEEIPLLAQYFVERYAKLFNRTGFRLDPAALERMCRYRYPGNVRELENLIKRLIVLNDPGMLRIPLPGEPAGGNGGVGGTPTEPQPTPLTPSLKDIARRAARAAEREAIAAVLEKTGWNRVRAAKLLRISYRALLYKIKEARLEQAPSRSDP